MPEGWLIDCSAGLEPLVFGSGAKAEAHAHALASRIARTGADARVLVHDRRHRLVGTTRYFADA
jgi:hypothetical protein